MKGTIHAVAAYLGTTPSRAAGLCRLGRTEVRRLVRGEYETDLEEGALSDLRRGQLPGDPGPERPPIVAYTCTVSVDYVLGTAEPKIAATVADELTDKTTGVSADGFVLEATVRRSAIRPRRER